MGRVLTEALAGFLVLCPSSWARGPVSSSSVWVLAVGARHALVHRQLCGKAVFTDLAKLPLVPWRLTQGF